jgi:hypothetical protein
MILQVDVYIPPIAQYPSLLVAIILQVNIYIPAPSSISVPAYNYDPA